MSDAGLKVRVVSRLVVIISCVVLLAHSSLANASEELTLLTRVKERGKVVFTYTEGNQSDIYLLDFQLGSIRPLVATKEADEYPVWSPNGEKIVFYSDLSGDRELYLINFDGTHLTRLTTSPGVDEDPSWSPDGQQIVFRSERSGRGSNLYIMKVDGSNPRAITQGTSMNSVPRWSPVGEKIMYSTNATFPGWDIMLLDLTNGQSRQLTSGIKTYCRGNWSFDGGSFIYSAGFGKEVDLFLRPLDGEPKQVTKRSGREYDAIFIGQEQQIFFVGELHKGRGDFQLFYLDMKESQIIQVTSSKGAVRYPSWTPGH